MESLQEFWDKLEQATPSTRLLYHAAGYADREWSENIEGVYKRLRKGVEAHKAAQEHVPEGERVSWVAVLKPKFSLFYEYNALKGTAARASLEGPDVPSSETSAAAAGGAGPASASTSRSRLSQKGKNARARARTEVRVLESLKAYKGEALKTQIGVLLAKAKEAAKRKPEDQDTASTPPEKTTARK